MRILDVGVAIAYGLICLSLVSTMSPYGAGAQADRGVYDARANAAILQYVQTVGLVFIASATPTEVCQSLHQSGNATLLLGGVIGGYGCGGAPAVFAGVSSVSLTLSGREVTIQAWSEQEQEEVA